MPAVSMPLVPKNPERGLNVVAIGRVSTIHQDVENIEASYRYIQEFLQQLYQGPMKVKHLGEQASGMLTERATIREAEDLVAGGEVDLVIAEDLARIYRNPRHQYNFVQDAVDMGTRVICVGDNLDTADENWEISMGAAALRHGLHIPDTRRRVRRTATHCFHKGGMVQKIRYGYRKLTNEEAAAGVLGPKDLRIAKRSECTPVIREMMQRVLRGDPYAAVAEWLDAEGIEPGPYVEGRRWTARLVVDLLDDPILSGTRTFRDTICRPIFKTGKHKPVKNAEPETEHCPELAHLTAEEHRLLRQEIARRREEHQSNTVRTRQRRSVPRSRTIWPGQAARCAICGGLMYYVGTLLKCQNSLVGRGQSCWNHVQVPAGLTRQRVAAWLADYLRQEPVLRDAMVDMLHEPLERAHRRATRDQGDWGRQIAALERQAANLTAAIAEGGGLRPLIERLRAVEECLCQARKSQAATPSWRGKRDELPSREQIDRELERFLLTEMGRSFEFADFLRRVFPAFIIQPVQAIDSGQVRPRAKLMFDPRAIVASSGQQASKASLLPVTLDLFEPPLHIRYLPACVGLRAEHPELSLKAVAATLGIHHMTVKRALDYQRRMEAEGVSDPYRDLHHRPDDASRWRHRRAAS